MFTNYVKLQEHDRGTFGTDQKHFRMTSSQVLEYEEALKNSAWEGERRLADKILHYIQRLNLDYLLDKLTRGEGNCFPLAILQQLCQEEIFKSLRGDLKKIVRNLHHQELRQRVKGFALRSNDERLEALKENYEMSVIALADNGEATETWQQYWDNMMRDGKWVDSFFVQATAFFLNLNIDIIETSGNERNPFYTIQSGIPNSKTISIGYVTGTHYQSLLPKVTAIQPNRSTEEIPVTNDQIQCPVCRKLFKNVLNHLERNKICKEQINVKDKIQLQKNAEELKRENQTKRKQKSRDAQRAQDPKKLKMDQNKHKQRSRNAQRAQDPEKVKKDQNKHKQKSQDAKRAQDPEKVKIDQSKRQQKCRKIETAEDRLREFRNATMFSAIFLCLSCQTRQFFSNIQEFTDKIQKDLIKNV